jgi:hypothetical protein
MTITVALATIYILGVIVGLLRVDGSAVTKVGIALVWPLGLLAFVVTIAMLIGVAAIAFPLFGLTLVLLLIFVAWMLM